MAWGPDRGSDSETASTSGYPRRYNRSSFAISDAPSRFLSLADRARICPALAAGEFGATL
jgi:hypothetical protein